MSTENLLIRAYDSSYGGPDLDIVRKIAKDVWPNNPKVYSDQGFVMTLIEDNKKPKIIGFVLYSYVKPEVMNKTVPLTSREAALWFDFDFKRHFNSLMAMGSNNNVSVSEEMKGNDEYQRCIQLNSNLKDLNNWNKITTHIIHITDFAMIKEYRGRGFGTYLLKTLIYSFPSSTRFGLEVAANNHSAINCYQKSGFITERSIKDYYGKHKPGLKMTLISSYNDEDVTKFIVANYQNTSNDDESKQDNDDNATYTARYADGDQDIAGIKKILYATWPVNVYIYIYLI